MSSSATSQGVGKEATIERGTRNLLGRYVCTFPWSNSGEYIFDIFEFYDRVFYPELEVGITYCGLGYGDEGNKVLGASVFEENQIILDRCLHPQRKDPRLAFTFGHEMGHWYLHRGWAHQRIRAARAGCTESDLFGSHECRAERQANRFVVQLLMPGPLVTKVFVDTYQRREVRWLGGSRVYWISPIGRKSQRHIVDSYYELCRLFAGPLCSRFGKVSVEAMAIRLKELGLVTDRQSLHGSDWMHS